MNDNENQLEKIKVKSNSAVKETASHDTQRFRELDVTQVLKTFALRNYSTSVF